MTEVNRKDLIATGKELNTLLAPEPKIKTVAVKTAELTASIIKAGKLLEAGDELSKGAISVLTALKVKLPDGINPPSEETDEAESIKKADDKTAKAKNEPTLQDLYMLAKNMNEVMGLKPQIATRGKEKEDLMEEIINNCYDDDDNCEVFTTDELNDASWVTLKKLGVKPVDPNGETKPEKKAPSKKKEKPPAKQSAGKKDKAPTKSPKKATGDKKLGVIASIIEIIKNDGPITKADILKKMLAKFPDRNEKSMKSTINTQIPGRINKERDFTVVDNGNGWEVK